MRFTCCLALLLCCLGVSVQADEPTTAVEWNLRGSALLAANRYDKAIDCLDMAIRLDPTLAEAYCARGLAYFSKNKYEKATADLTRAIELKPKNTLAYCSRGAVYAKTEEYAKAVADYTRAVEIDPKNAAAYSGRGDAYSSMKESAKAIGDYSKALEIGPKNAFTLLSRGIIYRKTGDLDKAIDDFTGVIDLDPQMLFPYVERGLAHSARKDYSAAAKDFSRAAEIDPKLALAFIGRAIAYRELKEYDKALDDFSTAVQLGVEGPRVYIDRAITYGRMKKYDLAVSDYSKAIDLDPEYMPAWLGRAGVYAHLGDYEKALDDYSKAIELNPKRSETQRDRGAIFYRMKRYNRAVTADSKAIELDPKNAQAYLDRGMAEEMLQEYGPAVDDFRTAIEVNPENPKAYSHCAWLLATCPDAKLRDGGKAVEYAKRACNMGGDTVGNMAILAAACAEAGRFDEAVQWEQKALDAPNGYTAEDRERAKQRLKALPGRQTLPRKLRITAAPPGPREQALQRKGEPRQHRPAVQRPVLRHAGTPPGPGVNGRDFAFRVDQPHEADAGAEILADLAVHLPRRVAGAEYFHRQVGGHVRDGFGRKFAVGQAVPGDERHVGDADETGHETERAVGSQGKAEVMRFQERLQEMAEDYADARFIQSHGLLHQNAVHQLAEPTVAIPKTNHVLFGGSAGRRPDEDALGRDVAQLVQQFGHGEGIHVCGEHNHGWTPAWSPLAYLRWRMRARIRLFLRPTFRLPAPRRLGMSRLRFDPGPCFPAHARGWVEEGCIIGSGR